MFNFRPPQNEILISCAFFFPEIFYFQIQDFEVFTQEFNDDGVETPTSVALKEMNSEIRKVLADSAQFKKEKFKTFVMSRMYSTIITMREESFESWQPFYALLPIIITGQENQIDLQKFISNTIQFLKNRESVHCGWGPSNYEYPQMVPLYGNLILLGLLGTEEAYELADRKKFYQYIMSCKNPDGSFSSCPGFGTDLRTTFSALFVAWILNIITPELSTGLVDFVKSCQTYEGGFSPIPNAEAHGGYTYCAIGILYILNKLHEININTVIRFIADRQDSFSGGFNGRTGKLVDSCYCWWVGSPARILANYLDIGPFWDDKAIYQFLLRVVQGKYGGFCDHPPNLSDSFHTLFGSAGLAVVANLEPEYSSDVPKTETISSIPIEKFEKIKKYFESKPFVL